MSEFQKVAVVGLGYIGLPTAAMFASRKVEVIGIDIDQSAVDTINRGEIHIIEPDLDMIVRAAVAEGYLHATVEPRSADAFLIAVPTPLAGTNNEPDLSYVETATKAIAPVLQPGNIVVLESTSPVGTTEAMAAWLAEARPDLSFPQQSGETSDIRIAHCPERVLPGKVMQELILNDRVIGGMTKKCSETAARLYKTFVTGDCIVASNPRVAEMAKLTENSFRDVNIAFANELSLICDEQNMDVWELIRLANRHPRVDILQPGPGVGGHCIAVDPWFIVASTPKNAQLIRTSRLVNDRKPKWVIKQIKSRIEALANQDPEKKQSNISVAVYGLAFKPDIDDLRESPALQIFSGLSNLHDGPLFAVEPNISSLPKSITHGELVNLESSIEADLHIVLVKHSTFADVNFVGKEVLDYVGLISHLEK